MVLPWQSSKDSVLLLQGAWVLSQVDVAKKKKITNHETNISPIISWRSHVEARLGVT